MCRSVSVCDKVKGEGVCTHLGNIYRQVMSHMVKVDTCTRIKKELTAMLAVHLSQTRR